MIRLRNALIATEFLAVFALIAVFDALPSAWLFNWIVFMLAVLIAIVAIQYSQRNELP